MEGITLTKREKDIISIWYQENEEFSLFLKKGTKYDQFEKKVTNQLIKVEERV